MLNISYSWLNLTLCPRPGEKTFPNKKEKGKKKKKRKPTTKTTKTQEANHKVKFLQEEVSVASVVVHLKKSFSLWQFTEILKEKWGKEFFYGLFYPFLSVLAVDFLAKYCIFSQEKLAMHKRAFEAVSVNSDFFSFPFFLFFFPLSLSSCVCRQLSRNNKHHCLQYTSHELR